MASGKLSEEIIKQSIAKCWDKAILEWEPVGSGYGPGNTCLCGNPISRYLMLRSNRSRATICVGDCCAQDIIGARYKLTITPLGIDFRRQVPKPPELKKKPEIDQWLPRKTIEAAFKKGVITPWEMEFYRSVFGKVNMSEAQQDVTRRINGKILSDKKQQKTFDGATGTRSGTMTNKTRPYGRWPGQGASSIIEEKSQPQNDINTEMVRKALEILTNARPLTDGTSQLSLVVLATEAIKTEYVVRLDKGPWPSSLDLIVLCIGHIPPSGARIKPLSNTLKHIEVYKQ